MSAPDEGTERRVGYTRGTKLHVIDVRPGRKLGTLLCTGRDGWRHPNFDSPTTAVGLSLSFNDGCKRCLKKLSSPTPN